MDGLKSAVAASLAARIFGALVGLVALPLYVRFLGLETYGLVGLFTSIQALLVFLDFGLAATLTKEVAGESRTRESLLHTRDLVWTFELAYLGLAVVIGIVMIIAAPIIGAHWLKPETLTPEQITRGLLLAAVALATQWPINLYSAGLAGLHRQLDLALVTACFSTLRVASTLAALTWQPTMDAFFSTQILASILQSVSMHFLMWRYLRLEMHLPVFKLGLLVAHHRFAGGMTAITISGVILTQMDKLILSRVLPLTEFGVYMVCAALAGGLYILISPMFSVMYPRFAQLLRQKSDDATLGFYQASAQAMAVMTIPFAVTIAVFAEESLFVLTGNRELSLQGEWVLRLLVIGTACNGLMNVPYALQLGAGWTRLTVFINTIAVITLAPFTWWLAQKWGAAGGAMAWCALNIGYVLITPQLMHKRLLIGQKGAWYISAIFKPLFATTAVAILFALLQPKGLSSRLVSGIYLTSCWVVMAAATGAACPHVRAHIVSISHIALRRILWKSKP